MHIYLASELGLDEKYLQTITGMVVALDFAPALAVSKQDRQRAFSTVAVAKTGTGRIAGKVFIVKA